MTLDPASAIGVAFVLAALLGAAQAIQDGHERWPEIGLCALLAGVAVAGVLAVAWALVGLLLRLAGAVLGGGA